jgi:hypothetical protein
MSPSNSSKSHNKDPPTYQQMQEALFKCGSNTESATGERIPTGNMISTKSDANDSVAPLDTESRVTSNPLLISLNEEQNMSQQYSGNSSEIMLSKSGLSEGTAGPLPVVVNLSGTKLIKPRPTVTGIEGIVTVVSESNISPLNSASFSTTPATNANNSPPTKVPERISTNTATAKSKGTARRRGKWTVEEEEYVARVIQDFNSGFLNAPAGYTLRSYLSDKLQCDPMRITKKFTGESCIGKRVFHPSVRSAANATAIDKAQVCLVF